jgi:FkbM family methyltransferase
LTPTSNTTFLQIPGGIQIQVPDSLDLITPYVLLEQGDWFEDEIKFLRRILRSGERIIDIGANYGTYAMTMAKAVGDGGALWAFEPASSTAQCLRASIEANGFKHVVLEQCALSGEPGTGRLALNANSELNAITKDAAGGDSEEVPVSTLDACMDRFGWERIDFMKIDAEGEEENILHGAGRFFERESPLVEFEYKAGAEVNTGLVEAFGRLGFSSYRLVPGLDVLVPFTAGTPADGYLLNLFCCKPDRAAELERRGILVQPDSLESARRQAIPLQPSHDWRNALAGEGWCRTLVPEWSDFLQKTPRPEFESALALYFFSQDAGQPHALRVAAMEQALGGLRAACAQEPGGVSECTRARVAREFGLRQEAVAGLGALVNGIIAKRQVDHRSPFLLPMAGMSVPAELAGQWSAILAAAVEGLECMASFSSFYSVQASRGRLDLLRKIGIQSPSMSRREYLLGLRLGGKP